MNYRHAYHAGNFCDVLKHAVLALALKRLTEKDKPISVLDTHAGIGLYDLAAFEAEKTLEYQDGIMRVRDNPHPALAPYLGVVAALNPGVLRVYPGSPEIARALTRPEDRLVLIEKHPVDCARLRLQVRDRRVRIYEEDGYGALKGRLPPVPRRGLVLIDPPFEVEDEFERLARGLTQGYRRFATGVFLAWYPIKQRGAVDRFLAELVQSGIRRLSAIELELRPDGGPETLNGCGLVAVNLPFGLPETLNDLLPWLARRLGGPAARWRNEQLVGE